MEKDKNGDVFLLSNISCMLHYVFIKRGQEKKQTKAGRMRQSSLEKQS